MQIKCVRDEVGYWTEGKNYDAETSKGGFIIVGDDQDPMAGWALILVAFDHVVGATYACQGLKGVAEFTEVRDAVKPLPVLDLSALEAKIYANFENADDIYAGITHNKVKP